MYYVYFLVSVFLLLEKMQLASLKDKEEKHMKGMYEAQVVQVC